MRKAAEQKVVRGKNRKRKKALMRKRAAAKKKSASKQKKQQPKKMESKKEGKRSSEQAKFNRGRVCIIVLMIALAMGVFGLLMASF